MPRAWFSRRIAFATCACLAAGGMAASTLADPDALAAIRHCGAVPAKETAATYGTVHFANSCSANAQPALQLEIARLHSFEASASRFEAVAAHDHSCAIAYWGAAMSARGNPLGGALGEADIATGHQLIEKAMASETGATPREKALIGAMDVYYRPYPDQITRARAYADAMDTAHADDPDDPDIAAFDGLAIIEGVDLSDKTYARQKRAGAILEGVMAAHPDHPGAPHYLIHAYDYTALAPQAVHAAVVYPTIAVASGHAQHMPAHIWSMLGEWDKSIRANRLSGATYDPPAGRGAVTGDIVYDHAFDFIAYARLQRGEDLRVAADLAASRAKSEAPVIVQARYLLERGDWTAAAAIPVPRAAPFDTVLARFTRAYAAARLGDAPKAARELEALEATRPLVRDAMGDYWAVFVDIYVATARAWLEKARGDDAKALSLLAAAATLDDGHEKHIYLENKILPVRESLADMQGELGHPADALASYEASLKLAPNRYRAFLGAARAAEALGAKSLARDWFARLVALSSAGDKARPGYAEAELFLNGKG